MAKYCIYCGQMNDDQAFFCTACGKSFPAQQAPDSPAPIQPGPPPPSTQYTAEKGPGAHKHTLTDVYLRDSQGKLIVVARLQSLLHRNYTIVDGAEAVTGFIEEKTHITHRTFTLQDASHNSLGAVSVSNVEQNRTPPNCWVDDASGNRLANIVFTMGRMSYAALKEDGSPFFQASLPLGGGFKETWENATKRVYAIQVNDPSFSLQMVLTTVAALDSS